MDLEGVRTFVVTADVGRFQEAAYELSVSQQAVSKRVATLERHLGVQLFARTARGARLTLDGQAFLPYARELLRAADRAAGSVRPGERALRVDVLNRSIAPAVALQGFYQENPGIDLDVVTLFTSGVDTAIEAVRTGEIDATFRAVPYPAEALPADIVVEPGLDSPVELLAGPHHPLSRAGTLTPRRLRGHRLWIPGIVPGTEWAAYYEQLSEAFGLRIDAIGPHFGTAALLDTLADSDDLATLVGAGDRYVWPAGHGLRRIPLRDPAPVYPHALVRRRDNPHPALASLRAYLAVNRPTTRGERWRPSRLDQRPARHGVEER
uniref:LysR family transcriptional regulator n=1 Tax=Streptomyces sp. NBC_01401 TaxID=2903854 RepID=A0AAU3H264_9ACTN